jgi:hypothetical protein
MQVTVRGTPRGPHQIKDHADLETGVQGVTVIPKLVSYTFRHTYLKPKLAQYSK